MKRKQCPQCNELMAEDTYQCSNCGRNLEHIAAVTIENGEVRHESEGLELAAGESIAAPKAELDKPVEAPGLSSFFYFIAVISGIGGLILSFMAWPDGSRLPFQFYLTALMFLIGGILQGSLFAAIGLGLHYLKRVAVASEIRT